MNGRGLSVGVLLCALLVASRAGADRFVVTGPTNLAWSACPGDPQAKIGLDFNCGDGGSVYTLVGTFSVAEDVAHAVSMDATVEISFPDEQAVPPFWDVRQNGCNTAEVVARKAFTPGCDGHLNAFCSGDTNQCDVLYSARITTGTNVLKLDLTLRPSSVTGVPLAASPQVYFAFALSMPMTHAGSCSGCSTPAVASWVSGTVHTVDDLGQTLPNVNVASTFPGAYSCAVLNGGTGCNNTPVRARTWGQLKALYR